ncbi:MAG: hypothetical protein LBI29_02670 [Rickettsiales bacterium]|jgi:hypothetical protein|nr:hypothetical protein [Rickettsiales bacterium]
MAKSQKNARRVRSGGDFHRKDVYRGTIEPPGKEVKCHLNGNEEEADHGPIL